MKKLQWLKTKVGLFLDPRILYLMNLPNGDSYIVLWFFLKDMAGMVNDDGKIYVSETEPLTTQLIAKSLHRRQPFIENGLKALEQVDLIERDEKGMIRILIWDELQSFHRDERRREQTNERVRRYRERQRLAQEEETQPEGLPEESPIIEASGQSSSEPCQEKALALPIEQLVEEAVVAEKTGDMPLKALPATDEGEESAYRRSCDDAEGREGLCLGPDLSEPLWTHAGRFCSSIDYLGKHVG
ncbi:phage replisome organizer N-terminal domain-containing protein [Megasphaera sp. DISK 18]|uniref:phage replisome organizer N-terminal domain-containing protein n=1 Tax=Megasphaera sp. DISK 18 TaxID=1776081 RepID=UPI000ADA2E6E|nr:phage replisome organizer N-terminal domain-containing protein [Megasphaera sp. DISK 18]